MRADLDRGAMGVGAGWPNRDMAQQTQTVTSTTSSLVQPRTGCVLHRTHAETQHQYREKIQEFTDTEKEKIPVVAQITTWMSEFWTAWPVCLSLCVEVNY